MKKLYLIIVATFIFILSLIFSVFFMKVTIVTDNFETEIAINESVNYDDIYLISKSIYRTKKINVSEDMIVSSDDTTTIGQKKLIIKYNYKKYEINFNVKYRVNFVVDNETVHSQLVSSIEEVNIPTNIYKEGNELIGWLPEIPNKITTNMEFVAQFTDKPLEIPKLNSYDAVYGDLLNTIQLPYNQYGKWEFVNDVNTTVGDAGVNKFEVQFIPTNSELTVIKDYIEINVEKQTLEFKNIKLSFEYDGNEHQPIYELDQEVKVNFFGYKKIDAGTYAFSLEIDDRNYKGSYVGSYVITKASVSIKVNDVSIIFGDEIPEISYEIIGFENKELLSIEVVIPNIVHAGEYEISVKVNNPNINATIHAGNLTILKSTLDPYNPSYLNNAVYGDKLETVHFENNNPNGYWMWKDGSVIVDTPSEFKAVAIFTPNETTDYDLIERELTIIVSKKELVINVLENEYVYDGQEHSVKFIIEDGSYTDVDVIGLLTHTNVGVYENNLIINDERYQGYIYVNLVINKATPSVDFDKSYTVNWNSKLESIKLPDGYSWKNNNQVLSEIGENQLFDAIFTPSDTDNYLIVEGKIKINVVKVDSEIYADEEYILNYNGRVQKLNNVTISHDEMVELEYIYELNGNIVENLLNAGTYKVTINLPSTDHYNETSLVVKVIINKAKVMELDQLESTFGTLLEDIELPQSNYGYWEFIEKGSVKVGNAGINEHKVRFVSTDDNYESFDSNVQIKVNKKELFFAFEETNFVYNGKEQTVILSIFDKDNNEYNLADFKVIGLEKIKNVGKKELTLTIEDDNYYIDETKVTITINILLIEKPKADKSSYVYNGHEQIYQIEENIYYSINGNKQINAGEYDVVIKLIEPENVKWSDNTTDDVIYKFKINKAESKPIIPTFNSIYGDQLQSLIFPYDENGIWTWVDSLETYTGSVGQNKFKAKFVHNEEIGLDNFEDLIVDIVVNVEKRAIELPLISSKVYNGLLQKADIDINEYYTVLDYDGFINAGTHQVKLQLRNPNNYKWINTENETTIVTFEITQATTIIENLTLENWTYNENNNNPSATTNFGTIVYTYSKTLDGEYSITVPTEAGTYYVKASVEGNANYTSASITTTFIINKAVVSVPTISNIIYNGELQKANVPTNVLYEVVENNGGIDAGTYKVILNLLDASNYKWNNNTFENVEISYKILQANNEWIINPSIQESWIYGTENYEIVYQAKFGNVIVEYKLSIDDNSTYTTIEPTSVGVYDVRFTVIETENYTKLVTYDCFEITKKSITKPTQDSTEYVYNGGEQIYVITENPAYNVNGNKQIYAGTYDVVISLSSDNYIWDDQTTNNVVYKFTIKKQNVTIPGESSKPYTGGLLIADESSYNKELYTVINNGGTDVGNYVVILTLKDIENYIWENGNASSIEIGFNITKTTNEITDLTLENWTFNQTPNQPTLAAKFGINTVQYLYSNEYDGEYSQVVPTYAGTYYVKAVIDGTSNYESTSLIKEFTINKAIVNEPTIPSKVYSGTLLKAEINNTSLYDVVENNGGSNVGIYNVSLKLVDSNNYKWSTTNNDTVIVKFEITKAPIAIPTANSIEYTGQTIVSDIANTDMYTVTRNDGGINVGSYEIVLSLVNSENYKWADTDDVNKTIYFNITQSQAVISTLTAYNWVYAETPKTPTVVSNYGSDTVIFKYSTTLNGEYTSTIPTDVRTYYVKAIIPETANYKSAEKTTTFDITIATTVMTNLQIVGWTYGQTPNTPTVEINAGIPEFLYSSSYNGVYTSTVPTNAGTYYVKAVVTETTNYTGDETTPIQFVISKADPVVNWPTYSGDNYEDKFDPIKQNNGTTNVTGIFTFSDIYFGMGQTSTNGGYSSAANGISSPLNIVFTPNDISNYNVISTTINVLLKPVAHIGTTYYGTIEKALDNAVSGNTIYIEVGSNPILKESKEIKENVMLAITYQGETIDNGVATLMGSYAPSILDSTLLKNTLTINENVTLTNRGTLTICGVLSGGQGGYVYGGNTGGEYTRILMKQSSRIDNFGTINCYGYIEEETLNNNSEVIMKSGSKMYMPFILRDFHGGTGITAIYNGYKKSILSIGEANISVFNQFEFSNVTAKTVYNHGSNMYAFGNLTANSQVNNCTINLIGTTNQYLIQLNDSVYSKLIYKFNRDSTNIADGICNIDFYGGAVINKLEMELAGTDVDTSTVYFPLSFRFNISFNKGVDSLGNEQTSNAVFSSGQKYKLLPGARMVVNSGVELTLGELNIYDSWNHDVAYVSGGQTNYPQGKSPAQLIVNGKLTINSIGGKIYSNVNGAQIVVNTNAKLTTYEAKTLKNLSVLSYLTDRYTFTYNLQLGSLDNTTLTTISSKGTYTYNNGSWS